MSSAATTLCSAILFGLAATAAIGAQDAVRPPPEDRANAEIYRRIDRLRRAAARLRLDGMDRDWAEFPQFSDPRGDAGGDSHRDILTAAIAPTESDLWLVVRTVASPATDDWVFCFRVDMWGDRGSNFRIELESLQRPPTLRRVDSTGKLGQRALLPHARVAVRHVVEIRVPYRDIAAALPTEAAPWVSGSQARPWVRVEAEANDGHGVTVDCGPSVASFRLLPTPFPLDTPLPDRPAAPVAVGMPVRGQWFVLQGPLGSFSHRELWAYDLTMLDAAGHASEPARSKHNARYHAWKQPVLSPIEGTVMRARSGSADSAPLGAPRGDEQANEVYLRSAQGINVNFVHFQKDSLEVAAGDRVKPGQKLGLVGNSGASDVPHLHVAVWGGLWGASMVPMAFSNVRVGLNPVPNDPWARELPLWEPRRGYFVEGLPQQANVGKLQ